MALFLRESDVEQLLTMKLAIELIERVHREYSTGHAIDVPRERTRGPKAALHILQGAVPSAGILGWRVSRRMNGDAGSIPLGPPPAGASWTTHES